MAVDLTTGSYDEEGIFNKYNDGIPDYLEKVSPVNDLCSLKNFRVLKIIKEDAAKKTLVVEGRFVGDDRRAIVAVERIPFDERDLNKMFTDETRVEIKFPRNDIYTKYHVYPANGFNGISIQVIHPAKEKDFAQFIDEPVMMVYELKKLYDSVVGPHFKVLSKIQPLVQVVPSSVLLTYSDVDFNFQFVLVTEDINNCRCSSKHVRARAIVKKDDLLSLRDLTSSHIPMLRKLRQICLLKLNKEFKIPVTQLQSYVLYPPKAFPFTVMFESIEKDEKISVGKAHYLDTVISNLKLVPDYYQKITLTYYISEKDSLGRKLSEINAQELSNKK